MNREDIVRMAKEAGMESFDICVELDDFAKLIAQYERERFTDAAMKAAEKGIDTAIALEREACAQMLEAASKTGKIISCTSAAEAIRARGQA
jgi:hypothetical protein